MLSLFSSVRYFYRAKKNRFFLVLGFWGLFLLILATSFNSQGPEESRFSAQVLNVPVRFQSNDDLFLRAQVSIREYPQMSLIQNNSLIGASSPLSIEPQVLAMKSQLELEEGPDREVREYIVREGDSLWVLADRFGITIDTIKWANDLTTSTIKPGQKLIILPVSGVMHIVKEDEILGEIAQTYKANLEEIVAFNNLPDESKIYIGDILIIPGGKMPAFLQTYSVPLASHYFIFPAQGIITQGRHWYNAVDVANKCGTPVYAAAGGAVQRTGWDRIGGMYVRILHDNGAITYYGHLSKILAEPGQRVSQGAMIGHMGNTGRVIGVTGCHLHFAVIFAQNPLAKYAVGSTLNW